MTQDIKPVIEIEDQPDYGEIARLANISFGGETNSFEPQQVRWYYEQAFGGDTTVATARVGGNKAGQAVWLWYHVSLGGKTIQCAQVIDLFVVPEYRSLGIVRLLYEKLQELVDQRPGTMMLAVPNPKSVGINQHLLKLELRQKMDIRLGVAFPRAGNAEIVSLGADTGEPEQVLELLRPHLDGRKVVETIWSPQGLLARLSGTKHQYVLHSCEGILLVTSRRTFRNLPVFLVCAAFCGAGQKNQPGKLRRTMRAAAYFHRRPLFLYLGVNKTLPFMPGVRIPDRIRPSLMQVQLREPENVSVRFDRFEAIDFDFA